MQSRPPPQRSLSLALTRPTCLIDGPVEQREDACIENSDLKLRLGGEGEGEVKR